MTPYPVHYTVEQPARFDRLQLAIRLVAMVLLGLVGISIGAVFLLAFIGLPVYAAICLSRGERRAADEAGGAAGEHYLTTDGPRAWRLIHWFSAISSWFGLVVDKLPSKKPEETVQVFVQPMGAPRVGNALARVVLGLPSAIVLAIVSWFGALVWLWSAIMVLVNERVGGWSFEYLAGLQRWTLRLLAYQASLVDVYPPFSFQEVPAGFGAAPRAT